MKKTFRITIKIKNIEFKEGLGKGILGFKDLTYDLDPSEFEKPMFIANLLDEGEELRKELIDFEIAQK